MRTKCTLMITVASYFFLTRGIALSNTYFPEEVGFFRDYQTSQYSSATPENINQSFSHVLTISPMQLVGYSSDGGPISYFTFTSFNDSIYMMSGRLDRNGETVHSFQDNPYPLIIPNSTVPGIYQSEVINHAEVWGAGTPNTWSFLYTFEVIGFEDITVKAGTFLNSLKVQTEISYGESNTSHTSWLAPGIGEIKNENTFLITSENYQFRSSELVNYGVQSVPLPGTLSILSFGLIGLVGIKKIKRKANTKTAQQFN